HAADHHARTDERIGHAVAQATKKEIAAASRADRRIARGESSVREREEPAVISIAVADAHSGIDVAAGVAASHTLRAAQTTLRVVDRTHAGVARAASAAAAGVARSHLSDAAAVLAVLIDRLIAARADSAVAAAVIVVGR